MKLAREQVSQLSDAELNRAMVWLNPPKNRVWYCDCSHSCNEIWSGGNQLDYMDDYNLTMPLAVKYRLCIQPAKASPEAWFSYDKHGASSFMRANPLRAICEVLLMIAMEREK
jgi:hypothetical protein